MDRGKTNSGAASWFEFGSHRLRFEWDGDRLVMIYGKTRVPLEDAESKAFLQWASDMEPA